jgi:hypothetical protein
MQRVQLPGPDPMIDRFTRITDLKQLIARYDCVLIFSKRPSLPRHPHPFSPSIIKRLES